MEVFRDLSPNDLKAIATIICSEKKFTKGENVFSEKDESEKLYILKSGRCEVEISTGGTAGTYTIYTLNPGAIFGEVGFIDGSPRSATVKCNKEAEVVSLSRGVFDNLCAKKPHIGHIVMRNLCVILARRLRKTDREFKNLYFQRRISFRKLFHTG